MTVLTEKITLNGGDGVGNVEVTRNWVLQSDGTYAPQSGAEGAAGVFLITPSNTEDLAHTTRGISFAVAGALKIDDEEGSVVVIPSGALAAGFIHPIHATRVYSTGTDATGIVGYY